MATIGGGQTFGAQNPLNFKSFGTQTANQANGFLNTSFDPSSLTKGLFGKVENFDPMAAYQPDGQGGYSLTGGSLRPTQQTLNDFSTYGNLWSSGEKLAANDAAGQLANASIKRGGFGSDVNPYATALKAGTDSVVRARDAGYDRSAGLLEKNATLQGQNYGNLLSYFSGLGNNAASMYGADTNRYATDKNTGVQLNAQADQALTQQQQADQYAQDRADRVKYQLDPALQDLMLTRTNNEIDRRAAQETAAGERQKQFALDQFRRTYPDRGIGEEFHQANNNMFDLENYRVNAGLAKPWNRNESRSTSNINNQSTITNRKG